MVGKIKPVRHPGDSCVGSEWALRFVHQGYSDEFDIAEELGWEIEWLLAFRPSLTSHQERN